MHMEPLGLQSIVEKIRFSGSSRSSSRREIVVLKAAFLEVSEHLYILKIDLANMTNNNPPKYSIALLWSDTYCPFKIMWRHHPNYVQFWYALRGVENLSEGTLETIKMADLRRSRPVCLHWYKTKMLTHINSIFTHDCFSFLYDSIFDFFFMPNKKG